MLPLYKKGSDTKQWKDVQTIIKMILSKEKEGTEWGDARMDEEHPWLCLTL